ncbi:MAG: hypothetical protein AB1582_12130 [Pseudomonadota bacterium]
MLFPETNNWRAAMQDVSAAIDETMGELVTVTPAIVQTVNFPSVPDSSKAVTVTAVFTSKAKTVLMGSEGRFSGHSLSPLVETSEPIFIFGYGVLPFAIRESYRITRVCSGETFEVTNAKPDGVSRIVCAVVQLGRQLESR